MDWLRINKDLPRHPKSRRLAQLLGVAEAWPRLIQLYGWAVDYAKDGVIGGDDPTWMIEDAAGWDGVPGNFVAAAVAVGLLDQLEDGRFAIHDWMKHNGTAIAQAEKKAEAMRKKRAAGSNDSEELEERADTVPASSESVPARSGNVPPNGDEDEDVTKTEDQKQRSAPVGAGQPPRKRREPYKPTDLDQQVFSRWRELWATERTAPLVDSARGLIIANRRAERVSGGRTEAEAQQDLLDAVAGWKNDDWQFRKKNSRLDQLLGNSGDVDKGLALFAQGPPLSFRKDGSYAAESHPRSVHEVGEVKT